MPHNHFQKQSYNNISILHTTGAAIFSHTAAMNAKNIVPELYTMYICRKTSQ
jgi:hypothetical protein